MKRNAKNYSKYKKVCLKIWLEREHVCIDCNRPIGAWDSDIGDMMPLSHNFAHGVRGRRSEVDCLDKDNIFLKCFECHATNDHHLSVKNVEWLR